MLKAVILDFDGTLVTHDILDEVCEIVGKKEESQNINKEFHAGIRSGLSPLITRINFLAGVSFSQIEQKLNENPFLMPGAQELLSYLNTNKIISILSSGNIFPVLRYYQKILGFTYIVGSNPKMENDTIVGIDEHDFSDKDFKKTEVVKILEKLSISKSETLAIGDSPVDKKMFELAHISIAINPKNGIEKTADYVINNDLSLAIPIIDRNRTQ